ncbi:2-dehydropantoate 2-reductase, partial [Candidatus Woesearchaeota archaeon]|nr:2-dehydropantoate 2-reductase [Candidatus Woesearchaeota archaeon]
MNIIALGAGAIGSLYGAKLSRFNDVLLVGNKQHVDSINKNGLKISGLENKTF